MIDKLSLTISVPADRGYLERHGVLTEDAHRVQLYKYMCELDKAQVFLCPHKYSDSRNAKIAFTKININPKLFECFDALEVYILAFFGNSQISLEDFNITRIDIASDIEGLSVDCLLSTLNIKKIRSDSFSFFKGTIYGGSRTKIRIYDKVKEIKARLRKGAAITEYEKMLVESGKHWTRFEIEIRNPGITLKDLKDDPLRFASYFDRLEFINLGEHETSGIMQFKHKHINRKLRKQLEEFKDTDLVEKIKRQYIDNVKRWFTSQEPF